MTVETDSTKSNNISVSITCSINNNANIVFISKIVGLKFKGNINETKYDPSQNAYILCVDPSRRYTITITHPDYVPLDLPTTKTLSVKEIVSYIIQGEEEKVNYSSNTKISDKSKSGYVSIIGIDTNANGAKIFIDNKNYGTIPLIKEKLLTGYHTTTITKGANLKIERRFEITENKNTILTIDFLIKKKIDIRSNVAGASIFIDNEYVGTTPFIKQIKSGNHSIKLSSESYIDEIKYISIANDTQINFNLSKINKSFKGKPSNAYLSMIMPGWGNKYVNKNTNNSGKLICSSYLIAAGIAVSSKLLSDKYYKDYRDPEKFAQLDRNYIYANNLNHIFWISCGIAGTIWASNVSYVGIRGFMNRKRHLKGLTIDEPEYNLYFAATPSYLQIGISRTL